jgi:hypothetical protein
MSDKFELDVQGIKESAARDELREGWYWFLAQKWKQNTDEATGHRSIRFQLAPMENPQDINSVKFPTMFGQFDMFDGKFPKGKKSRDFFYKKTVELCTAMFEELPQLPKKVNGKWYVGKEALAATEYQKAVDRAHMATAEFLQKMWADGDAALKSFDSEEGAIIVAGRVAQYSYDDKKTGERKEGRSVVDPCAELPAEAKLVPAGKFVDDGEDLAG